MDRRRFVIVVVAVFVAAVALLTLPAAVNPGPVRVCDLALRGRDVGGTFVALEDQGAPGRGECDMNVAEWMMRNSGPPTNVIGFDCKIRDPQMKVVATTTPNRVDGTCGQDDPPPVDGRG